MARWRLNGPHYLNVPGTEWEQVETALQGGDADAGEQIRHRYPVPRMLDPKDPKTRKNADGDVIVCYEGSQLVRSDYLFIGPPTLDMDPLDEEAQQLSDVQVARGQHPIESLEGNGGIYGEALLERLTKALEAMGGAQPQNVSMAGASPDVLALMQEQIATLMEQNAQMQAQLAERTVSRRS